MIGPAHTKQSRKAADSARRAQYGVIYIVSFTDGGFELEEFFGAGFVWVPGHSVAIHVLGGRCCCVLRWDAVAGQHDTTELSCLPKSFIGGGPYALL